MQRQKLVDEGIGKIYRINCSFYDEEIYALKWKDVVDFVRNNVGYDYEITSIRAVNLPFGFNLIVKGKIVTAEYDENERCIYKMDDNVYDRHGEIISEGMKVKLASDEDACPEDIAMKDKKTYNVVRVFGDKVLINVGYCNKEVHGRDVIVVN